MADVKEMWSCGECGDLHDYEDDAAECCAPTIARRWMCICCCADFADEDEAKDCCEEDGQPTGPTPAELEAAGQMRLAL